tara:strand:+ start:300 stop:527 length:228 start_codon:yes stop_codon:yes gene_type:complete
MTKIELTGEMIDEIVISELKSYYDTLNLVQDDWYSKPEDKITDMVCLDSIINILAHYLTHKEHKKWLLTLEKTQK